MDRAQLDQALMQATEQLSQGDVDGALAIMAELEDAVTEPSLQAQVWARYATLFAVLELQEEFQGAVHRALMLDDKNPRANYLNGVQLMVDERFDAAIAALHKAASLYPPDDSVHLAEVYGNLGYCHDMQGDKLRAEMYWEMAEDLDPSDDAPPEAEAPEGEGEIAVPPQGCGALERVEAMLRQVGVLGDAESLYDEESDGDDEDDGYWATEDSPPQPAPKKAAKARKAKR